MIYLQPTPLVLTTAMPLSTLTVSHMQLPSNLQEHSFLLTFSFPGTRPGMIIPLSFSSIWLMLVHALFIHRNEGVSFLI